LIILLQDVHPFESPSQCWSWGLLQWAL